MQKFCVVEKSLGEIYVKKQASHLEKKNQTLAEH
jgi:hypothetical protein